LNDNTDNNNRIAIALENAKSAVENSLSKNNNLSKIAQSRERSDDNARKVYGNFSTHNGTP
jgi:hypothetical protein